MFLVESEFYHDREYRGVHIIDLRNRGGEHMFRILDVSTEKCLHSWNMTDLLICDNIGSMVYVKIRHLGLLWMYSLNFNASEICECVQK